MCSLDILPHSEILMSAPEQMDLSESLQSEWRSPGVCSQERVRKADDKLFAAHQIGLGKAGCV